MGRLAVLLTAVLTLTLSAGSEHVRAQAAQVPPVPRNAPKVSVEMTILEPTGATLVTKTIEVRLGAMEAVFVQQKNRTVSVDTTINPGQKPGCYKIDLVVRDRIIDTSGAFAKTVWQSSTEPCDPQPITLGPKDELRVQLAVKPTAKKLAP